MTRPALFEPSVKHQAQAVAELRSTPHPRTVRIERAPDAAPEMEPIRFFVAGEPKGQPRPRAFAMNMGGGKFSARVFDAGTAEGWKSLVASAAREVAPPSKITGPVRLEVAFIFRRPKSHLRSNGELRPNAPRYHVGKPDADNLAKAVMDALTQMGLFWADDAQVAALVVFKSYGETPGAHVAIGAKREPAIS